MNIKRDDIINALKTVFDPEISVNIWDLGLIYNIQISSQKIIVDMTFTSPTCPMMNEILASVRERVESVTHGIPVVVNLVWEPAWDLSRMSEKAKIELDLTEHGW